MAMAPDVAAREAALAAFEAKKAGIPMQKRVHRGGGL